MSNPMQSKLNKAVDIYTVKKITMVNITGDTAVEDAERIAFEYDNARDDLKEYLIDSWECGFIKIDGLK